MKLPEIMKAKTKPLATIPLAEVGGAGTARVKVHEDRAAARAASAASWSRTRPSCSPSCTSGVSYDARYWSSPSTPNGKLNASTAKCVKAATALAGAEIAVAVFAAAGFAGRRRRRRSSPASRACSK